MSIDQLRDYFGHPANWEIEEGYLNEEIPLPTHGIIGIVGGSEDTVIVVQNGDFYVMHRSRFKAQDDES